ncbi:hypothetical protein SY27_13420 [Flavobacterium sp. 316]|nr:hypothetical protein SY27_13420 [Flavobacterium sp. 316]
MLFALLASFSLLISCSSDTESIEDIANIETPKSYSHDAVELELLDLVNAYRVENGLNPLDIIEHISYKSEEHNEYMISTGTPNHDGFEQRKLNLEQVLNATRVGENVAYGYLNPQSVLNNWKISEGHKANLEGNYTHFGVSIRMNSEGKRYYTNIFIKK